MMSRLKLGTVAWISLTVATVFLAAPQPAQAQRGVGRRILSNDTVSPYLNLLRPSGNVGLPNYQAFVKPRLELEERLQLQANQMNATARSLNRLQTEVQQTRYGSQFATGHPTRFMTYLHYYPGMPQLGR